MTGAPVPPGADAVVMLEHVKPPTARIALLPPRTVDAGRKHRGPGRAGPRGRRTAPRRDRDPLRADCPGRCLRLRRRSPSSPGPAWPFSPPATRLVPVESVPAPARFATPTAPCWRRWWPRQAVSPGPAHRRRQRRALSMPRWPRPQRPTCCSSPAAFPQASSIWSSRRWPASARASTSPACASSQASRWSLESCRGSGTSIGPERRTYRAFFGLPGNPVSSAVTFLLFAAPVLAALAGSREPAPRFALARLAPTSTQRQAGPHAISARSLHLRLHAGELPEVAFVPWQGSGDLAALARSNCFLVVPEDAHRLEPGAIVRILLS